ncbi:MAG: polysaccharide deacetylase family protein [Hyphomonadaceae bacterium]
MRPQPYQPSRSIGARLQRRLTQHRHAARVHIASDRPVVTFSFDDFPRSALNGADELERLGARGCFYASTGFAGQKRSSLGEMYAPSDLVDLQQRGHEIGAHTHAHIDCARMDAEKVHTDIAECLMQLESMGLSDDIASFAWPYGETTRALKRWAADHFVTARGVLPGVNTGRTDRAQLHAVELGDTRAHRNRARAAIKSCVQSNGWLIFFTHDVSASPTPFGVTPRHIRDLADEALELGAVIETPIDAARRTGVSEPRRDWAWSSPAPETSIEQPIEQALQPQPEAPAQA